MSDWLPYVIVGLATGSLYGIAGLGLVLTYRTTGVFNFAHGAVGAAAAYVFYSLHYTHAMPWPAAAALSIVGLGVLGGVTLERLFRPLYRRSTDMAVVATIGLMLAVQALLAIQFGNAYRRSPPFLPGGSFSVVGVRIGTPDIVNFCVPAIAAAALYVYLRRSRRGLAMRAVVDSPTLVALTGSSPDRVRRLAWVVGATSATLSGVLLAPIVGLDAVILSLVIVNAFGAVAIGLFKSFPLTYLGGLLVGVVSALLTKQFVAPPLNALPSSVPFIAMVVVLLAVPVRLLPSAHNVRPHFDGARRRQNEVGGWRRAAGWAPAIVAAAAVLAMPALVGFRLPLVTSGVIFVLVFASLAILVTTSGMVSLCHGAFVAFGASTFSHIEHSSGLPWGVCLVLVGFATVPLGLLVALPAIRLSGIYLALVTVGFAILMQNVVYPSRWMFGPELFASASRPAIDGSPISDEAFYYVVLAVVLCGFVLLHRVQRGHFGRLLRGLSESPTMMVTSGLDPAVSRLVVFGISAAIAGVAGGLFVSQSGAVGGESYGVVISLTWLAVLAFGGRRFSTQALLPAIVLGIVPGYIRIFDLDQLLLIFGLNAIYIGSGAREFMIDAVRRRVRVRRGAAGAPTSETAVTGIEGPVGLEGR